MLPLNALKISKENNNQYCQGTQLRIDFRKKKETNQVTLIVKYHS